ncbi:MAG: ABC transporter permease [Bacteroidales bacterium]|nr:ABC transporter permease [Bacteroidales bacterium]
MNTEFFIATRLIFDKEGRKALSRPIIRISVIGIALSLAVMIISVATVTGFKNEIRRKIIGFGSHIQIINFDVNASFETEPISRVQPFLKALKTTPGIRHIQVFATKPGIIKTQEAIQGAILKGIGSDFDWSFFSENLVRGTIFNVCDSTRTDSVLISNYQAKLLKLDVGDRFGMYFIDDRPRIRSFVVSGIYQTSLVEFDRQFILGDIGHIQLLNQWESTQVSGFEVLINDYSDIDKLSYEVFAYAGVTFNPDGSKLRIINIKEKYPQIFDWLGLIDKNVWVLLGLMLIISAFNMISGLLIIILDRTTMIGILKSLGMNNRGIRNIFLYQSAYLMLKGLIWGNLIGAGLCWLQYHFRFLKLNAESYFLDFVPINFSLINFIILNIGTLIITMSILVLPSLLIARISPAQTIRFD